MKLPRGLENQKDPTPPNAQWMTPKQREQYRYKPGDIVLGSDENGWIGSNDDRHLVTVAGSRAGKSSTVLKPNLLLWPSSVLCIDPKGELASSTALKRAEMGQDVHILDPFGEVKGEAAKFRTTFNPIDELRAAEKDDVIDDAALIAESMIISHGQRQDHWSLSAKNLIRGMCLYALHISPEEASLGDIREMLTSPLGDEANTANDRTIRLSTYFKLMMQSADAFNGVVAGVGGTMHGKPKDERGSIISTAVEQTSFLDSAPMQRHLSRSSRVSLRGLKQKPTTIYLVLPASRMATHYRWLRMILTLALAALEREPMKLDAPVLFMLEEFPQLGYMQQIEAAAGLMAGYGCKLHTVLQDLSQIKALYQNSWETFIGNAGVFQAFGNVDATTLEYISRSLGTLPLKETKKSTDSPTQWQAGGSGRQQDTTTQPLLAPFEIAQYCARDTEKQIVMFAGKKAAYINRLTHEEVDQIDDSKSSV